MRARNTGILLALAVAIGVYIYFFERQAPSTDEAQALREKVLPLKGEEIDRLRLAKGESSITCEKKIDGNWEMTSPLKVKADSSQVRGIVSGATSLRKQREFDLDPGDAGKYGLEDPAMRLTLWRGDSETEIKIGAEAPLGDNVYVALEGEPRAFLVPKSFSSLLDKDVSDLRDRTVLEVAVPSVTAIKASVGGEETEAVKEEGHWDLAVPVRDRADDERANGVIKGLKDLRAEEFVAEEPDDLARYGLADPSLEVALQVGAAEAGRVSFGDAVKGDAKNVYAKRAGATTVFAVKKSTAAAIRENVLELRSDRLFRAGTGDVQGITIRRGEEVFSLGKEGAGWKIVQPLEIDAEVPRVDKLLREVTGAKILEYAGQGAVEEKRYGLKEPEREVDLQLREGLPEKAYFGKAAKNILYARRGGGETVLGIDADLVKVLDAGYLAYIKMEVLSFDREGVAALTLKRGDGEFACERSGPGEWSFSAPREAESADGWNLDAILVRLSHLRAKSYVARAGEELKKYGLKEPLIEASVKMKDGQEHGLMIGKKGRDGYYAKTAGGPMIFTVPDSLVDSLEVDTAGDGSPQPPAAEGGE